MSKKSQSGKKLVAKIKFGDKRIVVAVENYKGKPMLVVREQYQDDDEWKWGKNGLNINAKKFGEDGIIELAKAIKKAASMLDDVSEDDEDEDEDDKKKKKKKKKDEDDDEDDEDEESEDEDDDDDDD